MNRKITTFAHFLRDMCHRHQLKQKELTTAYMLKDQFNWYLENQSELVKKYNGKFLVIKDKSVVGVYDRQDNALMEAEKKFGLGNFIIQECSPGEGSYTQTFHSRVAFA